MKRFIALTAVVAMLGLTGTSAEAGGVRFYFGGSGYNSGFRSHYPSYGYNRSYGWGHGGRVWHNTGHYDYHPGGYVPHGNHFHYIPGHYDWHDTSHWDRFRGHRGHHHHH